MASTIKVNNIQNQCGANIVNKCSTTITLGASGDNITLAAGATQSGFGRTGTVDWDTTAKTAGFTAVSGNGYFVNTTSTAITMTLPATPSAGDIVAFKDYAGTFGTNNLTIGRNGSNLDGAASDKVIDTNHTSMSLVYVDGTQGWKSIEEGTGFIGENFMVATGGTVTCCGDYKIHTFTGPGTFTVCSLASSPTNNVVDYLVVAGGAGGGKGANFDASGGGGAGGFRESSGTATGCYTASPLGACVSALPVTATGYPVTVGGGGAGSTGGTCRGVSGSNSVFSSITSYGGGGGGNNNVASPTIPYVPGGSGGSGGGGGAGSTPPTAGTGGAGNTPPVSPPQGQSGGCSSCTPNWAGGGGGGATVAGTSGTISPNQSGPGGAGATTSISGTPTAYAGGGGGGTTTCRSPNVAAGTGGTGGGGAGGGNAGTTNTGGGGGGSAADDTQGGAGGSGIVIIRYKYQ